MADLFTKVQEKVAGKDVKIVFPEGLDERILVAVNNLAGNKVLKPIVVGNKEDIQAKAKELNLTLDGVDIFDPHTYEGMEELVQAFVERRKGKATEEQARKALLDENYFGTMLVYKGLADGLVSGAAHSTADTVRPALQIIKTKEGVKKTSGVFIMARGDEQYVFADCAINIAPDSQDLAEIAIESANTAQMFDIDPRVAMLSFSTKGSAKSDETDKVAEAVKIAKEKAPELTLDGEFQFDAAFVPSVAEKKAPDSDIKGDANVFVFPSLEAGNIGYKIAQRLGGFEAVGPILQGLNMPVNDLSRGCNAEDVYNLALITAAQAL
ncbi:MULTISPECIES: phosphate acetyltransferase [Bacillus]|uniref:Phosphate acetyltransferase n=4 Tax=Bacillus amyloliquefaciens group TaxID=1938374 RepID=A0A1D9PPY2_BACVE|nr:MULTISPECIES: phosphate acetyltransferase [Bacillus]AIU75382.1 phosphotransacetylase [Bacillus subtilis]ARM29585.1 phosphate acetyltransferase [Bacillus vallismortis]MBL3613594.1 phosphate acetyltransferase [Bacillus sp. RHFS18]MBR7815842.1 phosphate acetyltransferase [Bacillus sp. CCNWLCWHY013]MCF6447847.1 phosphate acetyltransferase [Bacillus sp. MMG021]UXZ17702.1 phosphate acetyltransferase [Bacillus siamensis]COC94339.1 phosphotransacetylase [Streptococcus pneumoniae]SLB04281.1 phosp